MTATTLSKSGSRPVSTLLYRHRWMRIAGLLSLPLTWLIGFYIVSLALLLVTAFWFIDPFTSKVIPGFTWQNFALVFSQPAYITTSLRTLGVALAVTVLSALFAIPLGIFMAKLASPWLRTVLAVAVTLPLWAG
ncbi:MAG: ABC transporter permease, partial [Salinibacterium sp.]|nr:ABC transporter permease [Salinibacterium sp.]